MALCSLCSSIPWTSLPLPKLFQGTYRLADHDELLEVCLNYSTDPSVDKEEPKEPFGFPFHENLATLAKSAKDCQICRIAQQGVDIWINNWEDATRGDKYYIVFGRDRYLVPEKEQLWITKTYGRAQGFYVWARHPDEKYKFNLMAAIGFGVDKGIIITRLMVLYGVNRADSQFGLSVSPLSAKISAQPVDTYSGSINCLDLAATWVKECTSGHLRCANGDISSLPTRILDVKPAGDVVTLVDGADKSGLYVCLSYCVRILSLYVEFEVPEQHPDTLLIKWGDHPPYVMTKATLSLRQSGMRLSEMPQTFVDAIAITRHLGIRYLWIDSLCICQDDVDDWARESARMCAIYSNAHLTIAANRSSDCAGGCFHTREPRCQAVIDLPGYTGKVHATRLFPSDQECAWEPAEFRHEPLVKRGWYVWSMDFLIG